VSLEAEYASKEDRLNRSYLAKLARRVFFFAFPNFLELILLISWFSQKNEINLKNKFKALLRNKRSCIIQTLFLSKVLLLTSVICDVGKPQT
jgi:hypothetical protein